LEDQRRERISELVGDGRNELVASGELTFEFRDRGMWCLALTP
jgi:hypothetical protein